MSVVERSLGTQTMQDIEPTGFVQRHDPPNFRELRARALALVLAGTGQTREIDLRIGEVCIGRRADPNEM